MTTNKDATVNELMLLSRDSSRAARRRLFEDMGNLFLAEDERLSEQERAHISDIMNKLISDVEMKVRTTLSQKLSKSDTAPHELVTLLANDEIDVARPILTKSRVLSDPDLLVIIEQRSKEHLLSITEREEISPLVSDLLIEFGDEDVIEQLVRNTDAQISKEALALLVEESKRVDRFQEPLLSRQDLPSELAHKMFWWVSAALRRHILENFEIDAHQLDLEIESSAREHLQDINVPEFGETHADRLAAHLAAKNELNEKLLVQSLKSRQIRLFLAGLSIKSGLDTQSLGRFIHSKNTEAMAIICKALNFDRNSFSAIFLLTRRGGAATTENKTALSPDEIEAAMGFFDKLEAATAERVLEYWKLDTGYSEAIEKLGDGNPDQLVYL
jgi:uncharacterized protein (DUF2336 family)